MNVSSLRPTILVNGAGEICRIVKMAVPPSSTCCGAQEMRNTSRDLSVERKQPVSKTRAQPGIAIEERMLNLILLRSHVGAQRSCSGRAGLARPVWNRDGIPPLPGARLFGIRGLMLPNA